MDITKDLACAKRHLQAVYKQTIQDCQANLEKLESPPKGDKRPRELIPLEARIGDLVVRQAQYQILVEIVANKPVCARCLYDPYAIADTAHGEGCPKFVPAKT